MRLAATRSSSTRGSAGGACAMAGKKAGKARPMPTTTVMRWQRLLRLARMDMGSPRLPQGWALAMLRINGDHVEFDARAGGRQLVDTDRRAGGRTGAEIFRQHRDHAVLVAHVG